MPGGAALGRSPYARDPTVHNRHSSTITPSLEKPNLYAVFVDEFRGDARLDDPVFALVFRSFERVLRAVRRCLADGRFPGWTEFEVGRFLLAVVHGLASLELRGVLGDDVSARSVWRASLGAALVGLQNPRA